MPTSASAHPKTRPSSLACVECRKHHIKCDAQKPSCSRCIAAEINCVFLPSRRGARRRLKNTTRSVTDAWADISPSTPSLPEAMGRVLRTGESSAPQYPDPDHSNGLPLHKNSFVSIVPESRLIHLYYENLHSAHPILVPASLFERWDYPSYLCQVVKFIGSHYSVVLSNDILHESTRLILNETLERTPHMVQALLLYSIIMRARDDISQAESSLSRAIDIALELGMHREDYATKFSAGREYEAESLRRTWWELFIWEIYMATIQTKSNLRCTDVFSLVWLPCEELAYASLRSLPEPKYLASFRARIFADDEDNVPFSSFAYRIEAVRILAHVLVLNSLPATHHDQLQAVANTLVSWIHHLPDQKIDIVDKYGNIDEMLFQAHFTIQYAAMLLHLPRSNIRPLFPQLMIPICPVTPFRLSPSLTRHVHDVKTIEASKKLSDLLSVRSDARGYSPLFVFGSLLCGLVQLAAIERHGPECFDHHQNRVVLVLGCLRLLRVNWSLAQQAQSHLRRTAARIATNLAGYSPFEGTTPGQSNQQPNMAVEETAVPLPMVEDGMDDMFSSRILSEFVDPTCGDISHLFPIFGSDEISNAPNDHIC
ncbi:Transcription factor [Penicillium sp. IBT 16267x]|nr:Transcription factor [Penicillium sp. IBT 16267x]